MKSINLKQVIRISLGSFFLVLGAAGLVLPFLQGWLLLAVGAVFLSQDIKFFARMEKGITCRFPAIGRAMVRLRKMLPILAP